MNNAIEQARLCKIDVPVGCVIKKDGTIIASAYNMREEKQDIAAHAEILAIKQAQERLSTSRLKGCELFVTLEPCPMCGWAILQSRIRTVYFGSYDVNYGAFSSKIDLRKFSNNQNLKVYGGILEDECNNLLNEFFKALRRL